MNFNQEDLKELFNCYDFDKNSIRCKCGNVKKVTEDICFICKKQYIGMCIAPFCNNRIYKLKSKRFCKTHSKILLRSLL